MIANCTYNLVYIKFGKYIVKDGKILRHAHFGRRVLDRIQGKEGLLKKANLSAY